MKRKIVLIASILAGVLALFATRLYIASREAEVQRQKQALLGRYGTMEAIVFAHDVPGGTALAKRDLGTMTVPAMGLRGQALTLENLGDILGRKTLLAHRQGDVLFWADVEGGDPRGKGLSTDIKRQMRAISISVNGAASVSGMVKPNDHVDVIGTFSFPRKDADGTSRRDRDDVVTCTILQNVLVLATGKETAKARPDEYGMGQGYSMVTLEVTPREAEMLAFTEQMRGRLVLTLRNRNDTSYERELPKVDFEKIRDEIETLNLQRQQKVGGR